MGTLARMGNTVISHVPALRWQTMACGPFRGARELRALFWDTRRGIVRQHPHIELPEKIPLMKRKCETNEVSGASRGGTGTCVRVCGVVLWASFGLAPFKVGTGRLLPPGCAAGRGTEIRKSSRRPSRPKFDSSNFVQSSHGQLTMPEPRSALRQVSREFDSIINWRRFVSVSDKTRVA